jgi:hypothetical protein
MNTKNPKPLTDKERELIKFKIEAHGFHNAMEERLFPSKLCNERFHELRQKYLEAERELSDFIFNQQ